MKNSEIIENVIKKTRNIGVIIDTNLLLLLLVGYIDEKLVERYKRLSAYSLDDFTLLKQFLSNYHKILITPTILAEVSNLANALDRRFKEKFYLVLEEFTNNDSQEVYENITTYNFSDSFHKFGVTDSSISKIANNGFLVLTDDLPLAQFLRYRSRSVLNFNNIRIYGWR